MFCCDEGSLKLSQMTTQALFTYWFCVLSLIYYFCPTLALILRLLFAVDYNSEKPIFLWDIFGLMPLTCNIIVLFHLLKLVKANAIVRLKEEYSDIFLSNIYFPVAWVFYVYVRSESYFLPLFSIDAIRVGIWLLVCTYYQYEVKLLKKNQNNINNVP